MSRYVHHNKCKGGYAIDEVDGKTYCYGRIQKGYDDIVYVDECVRCPRLVNTFADKADEAFDMAIEAVRYRIAKDTEEKNENIANMC